MSVATSGVVRSVPIELSEGRPASSLWVVGCGDGFAQVGGGIVSDTQIRFDFDNAAHKGASVGFPAEQDEPDQVGGDFETRSLEERPRNGFSELHHCQSTATGSSIVARSVASTCVPFESYA